MYFAQSVRAFLLILLIQITVFSNLNAQVVAEFGNTEITLDEFEYAYAKNEEDGILLQSRIYQSIKNSSIFMLTSK